MTNGYWLNCVSIHNWYSGIDALGTEQKCTKDPFLSGLFSFCLPSSDVLTKYLTKKMTGNLQIIFFLQTFINDLSLIKKRIAMKKQIAVHLAEGFEEIEAVSIIDVLRRADIKVIVVSVTGKLEVAGAHQLKILADTLFEDVNYNDLFMIVLPGGMPGASNLDAHAGLKAQIKHFSDENKPLAAICAAPLVFGNMGILKGKQVVCYPGFESYLKGAEVLNVPVIESENFITGRGPGAAIQFALKIVEKAVSVEKAELVAKQMLVE